MSLYLISLLFAALMMCLGCCRGTRTVCPCVLPVSNPL
jgi:hypothetical protein